MNLSKNSPFQDNQAVLVECFAKSSNLSSHISNSPGTSIDLDRHEIAQVALDQIVEKTNFTADEATTIGDFIAHLETNEAQHALRDVPPHSTTLRINSYSLTRLETDIENFEHSSAAPA